MPAALIPALAGLAGGVLNAQNQNAQNRESQVYSQHMYQQQKRDNLEFWNMQNAYNSPEQQMKRFQEAGLNPHLIYGQGNSGSAGSIQSPNPQPVQFKSPEFGNAIQAGAIGLLQQYDIDIKKQTVDNLQSQNTVIEQEKLLKMAQTLATLTGEQRNRFLLEFDQELRSTSADYRREQVRQMGTTTDLAIRKDTRETAINSSNLLEAAQRMATQRIQNATSKLEQDRIRESLNLMRQDGRLKEIEIGLRNKGIQPNDPMWSRVVGTYLSDQFSSGSIHKTFDSIWNSLFK